MRSGFTGSANTARMFISLKPLSERKNAFADEIIGRLRPKLAKVPGASLYLQASQDVRVGGRSATPSISSPCKGIICPI